MKLIFCSRCQDVLRLLVSNPRACTCGGAFGMYAADGLHAFIGGSAIPLGFANPSLKSALRARPDSGDGERFDAFVIAEECPTLEVVSSLASLERLS